MAFITYCLAALVCLSGSQARSGRYPNDEEVGRQAVGGHRSCNLQAGTVCIPTACSVSTCTLFSTAVCIDDRCGCEARFFKQLASGQGYQDVTMMCGAANAVLSANFSLIQADNAYSHPWNSDSSDDEDPRVALAFFEQFNLLVVEIMSDITNYLKTVTEARPTQANIDRLKQAIRTLSSLQRSGRARTKQTADAELSGGDADDSDQSRPYDPEFTGVYPSPPADSDLYDKAANGFKQDAEVLLAILDPQGQFAGAVKSGNVAISDKGAQELLQEKGFLSGLGSLIKTGWNLVKTVAPTVVKGIAPVVDHVLGL